MSQATSQSSIAAASRSGRGRLGLFILPGLRAFGSLLRQWGENVMTLVSLRCNPPDYSATRPREAL